MPRVPTVEGPRVERAPLRGGENTSRAIPTAAGEFASGAGRALGAFAEAGDRIQERRDLDEAFRVETQVLADFSQFEQNLRKTRRGAAAKDVVIDVDEWWTKVDQTYGADVSPRVKQLTAKSLARARAQALESTSRYQAAEEDRAQTESYTAVNGQEIQRAITTGTPEALASAKEKIGAAVAVFGATRGWAAEQVAAEKQKWTNILHTQAVGNLVDQPGGAKIARDYFAAHRAEIDSANRARLEGMLKRAVAEDNATTNAAKWIALPFEEAIENANKINDPDERKLTIAAVRDLQSDKNTAAQLREREASDKVWQLVANGASQKQLPRSVLEQLNGKERVQVNAYYEAERKRIAAEAGGGAVKTDPAVYGKVLDALRADPLGTRPETFQGLSRGDIISLQKHRDSMLSKKPDSEREIATVTQQMNSYITAMGLKDEKKGAFQKAALDAVNEFKAANKREPSYEDRQKILDRLSLENSGGWFSPRRRLFQVPRAERGAFIDKTIPADEHATIVRTLKAKGIPVNEQTVLDMYTEGLK
jgi:hypothetical protein